VVLKVPVIFLRYSNGFISVRRESIGKKKMISKQKYGLLKLKIHFGKLR
jgi:hypothetical protein